MSDRADPMVALRDALLSPLEQRLARMEAMIAELHGRFDAPRGGGLERIEAILGVRTSAAGRMRYERDPGLKALGVRVGASLLFDRAQVLAYLRQKPRGRRGRPSLMAVR